jgi:2-oxoglutarate dehydrogenase E2 component (dihydrolipoamide succinyltransferase)
MVPVLRNAEVLGLADIEKNISDLAGRARKARLSIEEMTGGTFTISNGGIYGSMLSTPILNPPQSGILGMHNIIERPVAIGGKVEVRPMMYIALSYDHRVIDGKDSVGFLKAVKEFIEEPSRLVFGAGSAEQHLLEI